MKKIPSLLLFLTIASNIIAQVFQGTISSTGANLEFSISPIGNNITSAIGYFEFCIRYSSSTNITFSNLTSNTANTNPATGFPGLGISESSERLFGGYKYKRFIATTTIPIQTYEKGTEYKVFEVKLSSLSSSYEIQLATNYDSNVPNDYYFVVSDGAGNPLVDITGNTNFYPSQTNNASDHYYSYNFISNILPVELLKFQAQPTKNGNLLNWQTATEVNVSHFDIERSSEGKSFQKIGETKAEGKAATYEYLDKYPLSTTTYYRLKMNDLDGTSSYSNIVSVANKKKGLRAKVYPNPFGDDLTLDISTEKNTDLTIEVMDILGRQVFQSKAENTEGSFQLPISLKQVPSGNYFLKISDGQTIIEQKIVKH